MRRIAWMIMFTLLMAPAFAKVDKISTDDEAKSIRCAKMPRYPLSLPV